MPNGYTIRNILAQQRPRAARHEAGHATVAVHLGLRLGEAGVSIAHDGSGQCDLKVNWSLWEAMSEELWESPALKGTWKSNLEEDVLALLAGNAAEGLEHDAEGWRGWLEEAEHWPIGHVADEWLAARMVGRFSEFAEEDPVSLLLQLQRHARELVLDLDALVELVAQALLDRERISHEDVTALHQIWSATQSGRYRTPRRAF